MITSKKTTNAKYKKKKKNKVTLNLMIFMLRRKVFTKNMINKNLENTSIVENMVTLVRNSNKNKVN